MSKEVFIRNVQELKNINVEVKRLQGLMRDLRNRSKVLKSGILEYMDRSDQPEVEYEDFVIKCVKKAKRKPKTKNGKKEDLVKYFANLGLENPEDVFEEAERLRTESGDEVESLSMRVRK
jgi:hypothetical protein